MATTNNDSSRVSEGDDIGRHQLASDEEDDHHEDTEVVVLLKAEESSSSSSSSPSQQQRLHRAAGSRAGMLVALAGTFVFSLMTVCVRLLPYFGDPIPVFFVVIVRGVVVSSVSLWSCYRRKINPLGPPPYRGWLLLRGTCGFLSLSGFYFGLYRLRVADTVVLQKCSPVFTAIVASLWLGEPFKIADVSATLLSFAGVALVVRSTTQADTGATGAVETAPSRLDSRAADGDGGRGGGAGDDALPVVVVLASAVCAAVAYTTIRKLTTDPRGHRVDPMVLVLYFAFICVPGGAIGLGLLGEPMPQSISPAQVRPCAHGLGRPFFARSETAVWATELLKLRGGASPARRSARCWGWVRACWVSSDRRCST